MARGGSPHWEWLSAFIQFFLHHPFDADVISEAGLSRQVAARWRPHIEQAARRGLVLAVFLP